MQITLKKLTTSRTQATVVLDDDKVRASEEQAILALGKDVRIKGFRPGKAPMQLLREHIPEQRISEYIVQRQMPTIMEEITVKHGLNPIIRPRVELNATHPMTLVLTIVSRPTVTVHPKKVQAAFAKHRKEQDSKPASKDAEQSPEESTKKNDETVLLDFLAEHTVIELAPELIDEEVQSILEEQSRRLRQYGIRLEDWLANQKKTIVEALKELRPSAEKRLKIRFAAAELIDEWRIEVSSEEMEKAIDDLFASLKIDEQAELKKLYAPNERLYLQFMQQKKVEKIMKRLRGASQ